MQTYGHWQVKLSKISCLPKNVNKKIKNCPQAMLACFPCLLKCKEFIVMSGIHSKPFYRLRKVIIIYRRSKKYQNQ